MEYTIPPSALNYVLAANNIWTTIVAPVVSAVRIDMIPRVGDNGNGYVGLDSVVDKAFMYN